MQKTDGSLRMTENYHKLNYLTIPIVALGPDGASLPEQINTYPGTWCAASDLSTVVSLIYFHKAYPKNSFL